MKMFLLNMMTAMMPAMVPMVWIGGILAVLSIVLYILGGKFGYKPALWAARGALALGLFFVAAQGMGMLLGAGPSINFGDPRKFEFILVAFWKVGLAMLIPAWIIWSFSSKKIADGF